MVLEGGRVVQHGTQASLMAKEGVYQRLWRMQDAKPQDVLICLQGW
jgi:ABC-type multidrug transport system fused ATPase/permease subunit